MDIGSAVKALRNGGLIRRRIWSEGIRLKMLNGADGYIYILEPYRDPIEGEDDELVGFWTPAVEDILADDWELTL